jgi:Protein ENHANCED DISEASE RESISTANCE 2, C-terminal
MLFGSPASKPGCVCAQVRGHNYLSDKKKVEAQGLEAELLAVDLVDVAPTFHIARHLPSVLHSRAPFMFVMQVLPQRGSRP